MTVRWVRQVVFAALALTACGGTVKEDSGTPSERLQSSGGSRCKAACVKVLACGLDKTECDCACACPDGGANCVCAPCQCPNIEVTPAKCESDCNEAVQKSLASSVCAPAMLKLLDCLSATSCESGQASCKAESDEMKACNMAHSSNTSSPPSASTPPGSGGGVVCRGASGSGSASPTGSIPPPGAISCENGWESCSDGKSYDLRCSFTPESSVLACECLVDGSLEAAFVAPDCPSDIADVDRLCGWHLE
jgi:hypothetical protein